MPGFWSGGGLAFHWTLQRELQQQLAEVKEQRRQAGSMAEHDACDDRIRELKRDYADRLKRTEWCLF